MKFFQAFVTFDRRLMHNGKVGGYRVAHVVETSTQLDILVSRYGSQIPILRFPVTEKDASRMRGGSLCNPRKLIERYFSQRRDAE